MIPQRLLSRPIAWFRQSACPPTIRSHETTGYEARGVFSWLGDVGHAARAACGATFRINMAPASAAVSSRKACSEGIRPKPNEEQAPSRCIDDETLAALVAGTIASDDLASIDTHLARCAICRSVLADAAHGAIASTVADPALIGHIITGSDSRFQIDHRSDSEARNDLTGQAD